MKSARAFGPPDRPWEAPVPADGHGWPLGDAGVVVFASQPAAPGIYDLKFRGRAEARVVAGSAHIGQVRQDPASGFTSAEVRVPPGTDHLSISFTKTRGGVRDVSLIRRNAPMEGPFARSFLDVVRRFQAVRFMDWQRTNGSPASRWDDRAKPDDARWSGERGVPLEIQIELANRAGVDAWFCVPHLADDDYVRHMAEMVHDRLAAGRTVYVEYSNECWNGIFAQAAWCREQGVKKGLSGDAFQAQLRYYSQRSAEVAEIWRKVFSDRPEKLVRVLASQFANPWVSEQVLEWKNAARQADALSVAPYFGLDDMAGDPRLADDTPVQVLDGVRRKVLDRWLPDLLEKQAAIARRHGVDLNAYEGGQHLVGAGDSVENDRLTALLTEANRHPEMGRLYNDYLGQWQRQKAGRMFLFSLSSPYGRYGSWGLFESLDRMESSPKWKAVEKRLPGR